jgi:2-amino-4-hydroxy-6-hydroxymethyldihydropteridine diphosphokinase
MTRAILSLGSNLGDREGTVRAAVRDIAALPDVAVLGVSSIVETPAWKPSGVDATAPAYLNAAVSLQTSRSPHALLAELNGIEASHGRVREVRWGDRTLDIDIVVFGDLVSSDDILTLPHPRAAVRDFVLVPWLELEPHAQLQGVPVPELLAAVGDTTTPYPAEPLL